jgi:predicted flap endonuclease-1-like 5' DNA nuclease
MKWLGVIMDRSVKSLLIITLMVAALFVAMDRIVQNAPLGDWWLVAALLAVAVLIYVWDRQASAPDTDSLVEPGQSSLDGFRQAVSAPAPAASIAPKTVSQSERDHQEIVEAYGEIRDTDVRSDVMASAATMHTAEAHSTRGMVENVMDKGATGTFEEVDEIAGSPGESQSGDHASTTGVKAEPLVSTPVAAPTPAPAPTKAKSAAKKAAPAPAKPDDLTAIEGIGPKMAAAMVAAGLDTFAKLSQATEAQIHAAIESAGMRFAPSVPTWAHQADLAAKGDWDALKTYQGTLKGGRKK